MWRLLCCSAAGLLLVTLFGCLEEPVRSNPFDARSDAFAALGGVTGRVVDGAGQPLVNVAVRLEARADAAEASTEFILTTRTEAEGEFRFEDVPAGAYQLVVMRDAAGATVRHSVEVSAGRVVDLQTIVLNAPPIFGEVTYDAVHLRSWSVEPGDVYLLELAATVTDPEAPDGGVDEVWLEVPALEFTRALPEVRPGLYAATLDEGQLPGEALHALVGLEMLLKARDGDGTVNETAPLVLERVIEPVPVPAAPDSFNYVPNTRPTFRWETFQLPYPFTFTVRVEREQDDLVIPVWEQQGIAPSDTMLQMSDALAPGTYRWTVAAVDAFGNRGRSAQAGFRVAEE